MMKKDNNLRMERERGLIKCIFSFGWKEIYTMQTHIISCRQIDCQGSSFYYPFSNFSTSIFFPTQNPHLIPFLLQTHIPFQSTDSTRSFHQYYIHILLYIYYRTWNGKNNYFMSNLNRIPCLSLSSSGHTCNFIYYRT